MIKIFFNEMHRLLGFIDIKATIHNQNEIITMIGACLLAIMQFCGINQSVVVSIAVLFAMILVDFLAKKTVVARRFGSIKKARQVDFWRSHISREKLARKIANYSFIMIAVFLMTMPLSFYADVKFVITLHDLQQLLRIVANAILISIEFDSVMENIKSQFKKEEREKIEAIEKRIKAGTVGLFENKIDNILNAIKSKDQSELPDLKREDEYNE